MKKKILSILLISVMVIGLTGCGSNKSYSLGDKVSTDIVEFTIENAKLAVALDSYADPVDYEKGKENNYSYVASKGHVYAALTLIIKNLDRTKLNINKDFLKVKYNGKSSENLKIVKSSEDLAKWDTVTNISLDENEELTYKTYVELDCEAKSLEDNFEVIVNLPKSDKSEEKYNFSITKSARENVKPREITLETAISNFNLPITLRYFEKHLDEFETLTGNQINEFIKSNDGDHYINLGGEYKHYEFTEMKPSGNNLIIWPGGTGASSFMYDVGVWGVDGDTFKIKTAEYIVKKLDDRHYLLVYKKDNNISGIMR